MGLVSAQRVVARGAALLLSVVRSALLWEYAAEVVVIGGAMLATGLLIRIALVVLW